MTRVRLIGDVHGDAAAFAAACDQAQADGLFVLQLGDLVDCGPDAPGCLRIMRGLMAEGAGTFVRGNHDDRFRRHRLGNRVSIRPEELGRTLAQLAAAPDGEELAGWFVAAVEQAPLWLEMGHLVAVHGGFDPAMPETDWRSAGGRLRALALMGESAGQRPDGLPIRTYGWVDTIPAGRLVAVGHDIRATDGPLRLRGALGGEVAFLDTGAGRGGKLSWLDLVL